MVRARDQRRSRKLVAGVGGVVARATSGRARATFSWTPRGEVGQNGPDAPRPGRRRRREHPPRPADAASKHGYEVEVAASGEEALALVDAFGPDVILTDVRMPKMGGLDSAATLQASRLARRVIVMSAYGTVDLALEAMKAGAYDYVGKPFKPDEIVLALRKAEERETLRRENRALKEADPQGEPASSDPREERTRCSGIFRTITKIADYKTTVLITGESGTGKELVARALHARSSRARAAVRRRQLRRDSRRRSSRASSSATSGRLHRRARRQARALRGGRTAARSSSTRSASCRSRLQVKLLRVLQEGDDPPARRDEGQRRSTCASSPRRTAISPPRSKAGRFREDLFYRLNVLPIIDPAAARAPRGHPAARRPLRRAQQRAPRHADPRRRRPRRGSSCSSTRGPATCASSRTRSSARWCSPRATCSTPDDLPERAPRARDSRRALQLASGELSIKKTAARIEEILIRRALQKTSGNRTRAAEAARDQPPRAALQDQGLRHQLTAMPLLVAAPWTSVGPPSRIAPFRSRGAPASARE